MTILLLIILVPLAFLAAWTLAGMAFCGLVVVMSMVSGIFSLLLGR